MKSLRELDAELDAEVAMEVPQTAGTALKALAAGNASSEQQVLAYHFIINGLARVDRLAFALPGDSEVMAWRNGRRFVGLQLQKIVATPMDEPKTEPPRARSITETVRRRRSGT